MAEQLICNQQVVGSTPITSSKESTLSWTLNNGRFPEWPKGADCKSVAFQLRWSESTISHQNRTGNRYDVSITGSVYLILKSIVTLDFPIFYAKPGRYFGAGKRTWTDHNLARSCGKRLGLALLGWLAVQVGGVLRGQLPKQQKKAAVAAFFCCKRRA